MIRNVILLFFLASPAFAIDERVMPDNTPEYYFDKSIQDIRQELGEPQSLLVSDSGKVYVWRRLKQPLSFGQRITLLNERGSPISGNKPYSRFYCTLTLETDKKGIVKKVAKDCPP